MLKKKRYIGMLQKMNNIAVDNLKTSEAPATSASIYGHYPLTEKKNNNRAKKNKSYIMMMYRTIYDRGMGTSIEEAEGTLEYDTSLYMYNFDMINQKYLKTKRGEFGEALKDKVHFTEHIIGEEPRKLFVDFDHDYFGLEAGETEVTRVEEFVFGELREAMIMALRDLWDVEDYDVNDIAICCRKTPTKLGYHLIMTKWAVPDKASHNVWISAVKEAVNDTFARCIDRAGDSLTLPGTYKKGYCLEPMTDHTMYEFMITYPAEIVLESLGDTVSAAPQVEIGSDRVREALIIAKEKIEYANAFDVTKVKGSVVFFRRIAPSWCAICERTHDNDNSLMISISGRNVYEKCLRSKGKSRLLGELTPDADNDRNESIDLMMEYIMPEQKEAKPEVKLPYAERLVKSLGQPKQSTGEIRRCPELPDVPFLAVTAPMDAGKTHQFRELINNKYKGKIVRSFTMRISQADEAASKMPGFEMYSKIEGDIDEKYPWVIVQAESMWRLTGAPNKIELAMFDEIESFLGQMFSKNMKYPNACHQTFIAIVKYAKKLIIMDANLSKETKDLITSIRGAEPVELVVEPVPKEERHYILPSESDWLRHLFMKLEEKKKVWMPTNYGEEKIETLKKAVLEKFPGLGILVIHQNITEKEKKEIFSNVNTTWKKQLVITSPTTSPGISFDIEWFDCVFALMQNGSCPVNYSRQLLRRVRKLNDKEIYSYVFQNWSLGGPVTIASAEASLNARGDHIEHHIMQNAAWHYNGDGRKIFTDQHVKGMAVNNILEKGRSRSFFLEQYLRGERRQNPGVEFIVLKSLDGAKAVITKKEAHILIKKKNEEVKEEKSKKIAGARDLTSGEYEAIRDGKDNNEDDHYAKRKYELVSTFRVDAKVVDKAFVEKYNTESAKRNYRNMRAVLQKGVDEITGRDAMEALNEDGQSRKNPVTIAKDSSGLQHHICSKIIRDMGFGDLYGDKEKVFENVVKRDDLLGRVKGLWIWGDVENVSNQFGRRSDRPVDPSKWSDKLYLLNALRYINSILDGFYGVKACATNAKRQKYKLEFDDKFTLYHKDDKIPYFI